MTTHPNGQLPPSALEETSGGRTLAKDAAASYERLSRAFEAKFGHPLKFNNGWTGYRTLAQQKTLYAQLGAKWAAYPGTSNHGWGVAGDFGLGAYSSDTWKWMNTVGRTHGWAPYTEKDWSYEPWHWHYDKAKDKHIPKPKPPVPPKPTPEPEDEVPTIKSVSTTKSNQKIGTVIAGSGDTAWTTVAFSDDGKAKTIVADPDHSFLSDVKLSLSGVPVGGTVQGRAYWVDTEGDGSEAVRGADYQIIERIGTDGNTSVDWVQVGGKRTPIKGKESARVRVEIQAIVPKGFKGTVNVKSARAISQVF